MKTIRIASAVLSALLLSAGIAQAADHERPMKPHSHMEEKMGAQHQKAKGAEEKAAKSTEEKTDKVTEKAADKDAAAKTANDKGKHLHPRDGK